MRRNAATILFFAAGLLAAAAAFTVLTGGFSSAALVLRDPVRPLAGAIALLAAAWAAAGAEFGPLLRVYAGSRARVSAAVAIAGAACMLAFALAWASRAAGGSDSSCYVLQAKAFAHGHATLDSPLASELPDLPNAAFAPSGFLPSRDRGHAVPICAPGLSLVMAAAFLVHPSAVFAVVPVSAALLVWLTFLYGRRLDDEVTGLCAAVLVACSPIVLYQAVQPMSDIPAAAAWMAALVSVSPLGAGVWAALAILIRPNLALLVPLLALTAKRGQPPFPARENGDSPLFAILKNGDSSLFLAGLLPGALALLALNWVRYGSPFATGYGSTEALFARAHVYANLLRYPQWVLQTQTPFVLLAPAAPWVLRRDPERARLAWVSLAAIVLLVATYLAYTVFFDWWYIRFLLPAGPMAIGMSAAVLRAAARRLPATARLVLLAATVFAVSASGVRVALERHVTELQGLESRFRLTGEYAARALPAGAVFIAGQQSGSVRFHGGRETIAWDAIPEDALDATVEQLGAAQHPVYIALEDAEEPAFRLRFRHARATAVLDARPGAIVRAPVQVRLYGPLR